MTGDSTEPVTALLEASGSRPTDEVLTEQALERLARPSSSYATVASLVAALEHRRWLLRELEWREPDRWLPWTYTVAAAEAARATAA